MNDLPRRLRDILRPLIPERAFLKRARADAAFITNAPLWDGDAKAALTRAGFLCIPQGKCLLISPGAEFLTALEENHPDAPDFFCKTLLRFRGCPPCEAALKTFADGIRLLESPTERGVQLYNRQVRQLAAYCLRTHRGGAYACALLLHLCLT